MEVLETDPLVKKHLYQNCLNRGFSRMTGMPRIFMILGLTQTGDKSPHYEQIYLQRTRVPEK